MNALLLNVAILVLIFSVLIESRRGGFRFGGSRGSSGARRSGWSGHGSHRGHSSSQQSRGLAHNSGGMSHIGSYPGWGSGQAFNSHGNGLSNLNQGNGHRQAPKIGSNHDLRTVQNGNNLGNGFAKQNLGSGHRQAPNINLPKPSAPKVVNQIKVRNQFFVRNDVYHPPVTSMAVIRGWRVRPLIGFHVHFDLHAPHSQHISPHYWMDQNDDRRTCEILTSRAKELKPTDLEKWKFACTVYDSVPGKCNIELLNDACFDPMAYTRTANCLEQNLPQIESQCLEEAQECCKFKQRNGLCEIANIGQKCGEQAVKFHYKLPPKICEKCDFGANDGSVSERNASRISDSILLLNSTEETGNEKKLKDAIANHKDANTALQERFGSKGRRLNGDKNGADLASHAYETLACEKCDFGANNGSVSERNASRISDSILLLNSTEETGNEKKLKDAIANHKDANTALQERFGSKGRRLNGDKNGADLASHAYETLACLAAALLLYFIR